MAEPDHIYDPDDWEYTMPWSERDQLAEDVDVEHAGIKRFATLIKGPDKFCVWVNDGYAWFNTRGEAEAAFKAALITAGDVGGSGT